MAKRHLSEILTQLTLSEDKPMEFTSVPHQIISEHPKVEKRIRKTSMGSSMPAASVYSGKCTPAGIYRYSYFLLLLRKENRTETEGEKTHANEINNYCPRAPDRVCAFVYSTTTLSPPPYRIDNDDKDNVIIDYVVFVCVCNSTGRKCAVQDLQIAMRARESSSSGRGSIEHRGKLFSHHIPILPSTWLETRPNIFRSEVYLIKVFDRMPTDLCIGETQSSSDKKKVFFNTEYICTSYPPEVKEEQSIVFTVEGQETEIVCIVHAEPKADDPVRKLTHGNGERSKLLLSRWDGSSWCSTVICLSWKLCKLKITPKLRSFVICRYTTFPRHVFVRSAAFRRRTTASVIIIALLAHGGGPRKSLGRPTNYCEYTPSPSKWK
ncbi:brother of CDO-like, partial [Aphis craccivora]